MERFKKVLIAICLVGLFISCSSDGNHENNIDDFSYNLGVVAGFSELIAADVKKLALSSTMSPDKMDHFIKEAQKVASKHNVSVYRESDLIVTDLFPEDVAKDLDVLLLFKGNTLDAYKKLKEDKSKLVQASEYKDEPRQEISRRFGRMLSYSPKKINHLLAENTSFRTMNDFGTKATNLFLYYKDLKAAGDFYSRTLGFEIVADYKMALILRMTADSYLILVDANAGMHTADEPKTVALAFLTDELQGWYDYLKEQQVQIKYDYKPNKNPAHDGFVAIDPEGYLLEFEKFKQHQENENFIEGLSKNVGTSLSRSHPTTVPDALKIHSTITWLYYDDVLAMQSFYENVFGIELVADQGWTKIYQVTDHSYLAIVDGNRGMHKTSKKKAVNVGFIVEDLEPWFEYVKDNEVFELREDSVSTGPESRYKAFVGYGPEDYYLEFDKFYPHQDNKALLNYLDK